VIAIGTRGSALARAQANWVLQRLQALHPDETFETRVVRTTGDRGRIETKGAFIKELEQALLDRDIDLAVHSLKDMPTAFEPTLDLVAFPQRVDPRDALISPDGRGLAELPVGARIGTGSPRRASQLLAHRPDLCMVEMKGNVDTRLRKLAEGQCDAIVLAVAGLLRLDLLERVTETLDPEVVMPAVGQGALALEARADDEGVRALVADFDIAQNITLPFTAAFSALGIERRGAERAHAAAQIAAYGRVEGDAFVLDGLVARPDGTEILRDRLTGAPDGAEALGRALGDRLLNAGAARLLGTEVR